METYVVVGLVVVCGLGLFGNLLRKTAVCPHCGKGAIRPPLWQRIGMCDKCGDYAIITDRKAAPIDPGFVAMFPTFELTLGDLADPAGWADPWSGRCSVCGEQTIRRVPIECHKISEVSGNFITSTVYKLELGCCQGCEKPFGSDYINPPAFKERSGDAPVMFRSYPFWLAFKARNGKRSKRQTA